MTTTRWCCRRPASMRLCAWQRTSSASHTVVYEIDIQPNTRVNIRFVHCHQHIKLPRHLHPATMPPSVAADMPHRYRQRMPSCRRISRRIRHLSIPPPRFGASQNAAYRTLGSRWCQNYGSTRNLERTMMYPNTSFFLSTRSVGLWVMYTRCLPIVGRMV